MFNVELRRYCMRQFDFINHVSQEEKDMTLWELTTPLQRCKMIASYMLLLYQGVLASYIV